MNFLFYQFKAQLTRKILKKTINKNFWIFLVGCVFILVFVSFSAKVFSADLNQNSTTISDSRPSIVNVVYNYEWSGSTPTDIRCVLIKSCTTSTGTCTVPTGMDTTGAAKGTFTGLIGANWTLDAATNGTLKLTNVAGETPGVNVSLAFNGIKNPTQAGEGGNSYATRVNTYSNTDCTADVDEGSSRFNIISGISVTATVVAPPTTANIIFKGKSSPSSFISIFRNGVIAGTDQSSSSGYFSKKITAIPAGISVFGIYGKDTQGRNTRTIYYTLNLAAGTSTTVSGVFLSPTISLSTTQAYKGEKVIISGTTYPFSTVSIFLSPGNKLFTTKARANGRWSYSLSTNSFGQGTYDVMSRALSPLGEYSDFSKELSFEIFAISERESERECRRADLNLDGKVDIVDFSILLYYWGQKNPMNNCANINDSGKVDLVDFSIMMYEWTD